MVWDVFAYTVLPVGAVLVTALASGNFLAMKLAAPVLQKRVEVGFVRLSLSVLMLAVCGVLSAFSFSEKSHYEEEVRAANLAEERLTDAMYFRKMDRMHQSRGNLYCALLGLALWAIARQLEYLHGRGQLTPPRRRGVAKGLLGRALWLAVGAVALLGGDIPLCRAHYAVQISVMLTPWKQQLLAKSSKCEDATAAQPHFCEQFCEQARALAEERLATIRRVRDWHPLGRVAAEVFDDTRGVEQGADRIDQLFAAKTCAQVIRRSDASNMLVNCFCVALGGLLVVVAFSAFSEALSDSGMVPAEEGEPPTVPGVPAVNRKAD
mmetsp:Transcript_95175/g.269169  ORF Transcript_95175/g.269169 Transcript_95175/m.269169 type:complete len:322 (+) Transcript_95175:72-1037(+)